MKVTVHAEGSREQIASALREHAAVYHTMQESKTTAPTKKSAKSAPETEYAEEDISEESYDDDAMEAEGVDEDDVVIEEDDAPKGPSKKEVLASLGEYVKKKENLSKMKAHFQKIGIKNSKDLQEKHFAGVLKLTRLK